MTNLSQADARIRRFQERLHVLLSVPGISSFLITDGRGILTTVCGARKVGPLSVALPWRFPVLGVDLGVDLLQRRFGIDLLNPVHL